MTNNVFTNKVTISSDGGEPRELDRLLKIGENTLYEYNKQAVFLIDSAATDLRKLLCPIVYSRASHFKFPHFEV